MDKRKLQRADAMQQIMKQIVYRPQIIEVDQAKTDE